MLSWFEHMGIMIVLNLAESVVKNPAKAAGLKGILLSLADNIYSSYQLTPPAHD